MNFFRTSKTLWLSCGGGGISGAKTTHPIAFLELKMNFSEPAKPCGSHVVVVAFLGLEELMPLPFWG